MILRKWLRSGAEDISNLSPLPQTTEIMQGEYSLNGGTTWETLPGPGIGLVHPDPLLYTPTAPTPPYLLVEQPSIGFDSQGNFYVLDTQLHSAAVPALSGAVTLSKYSFVGNAASGGTGVIVDMSSQIIDQWTNGPADMSAVLAVDAGTYPNTNPVFTGTLTNGSAVVTGIRSTIGLVAGQPVTGPGVASSTTILSVNSSNVITLSQPATANGAQTLNATSTPPAGIPNDPNANKVYIAWATNDIEPEDPTVVANNFNPNRALLLVSSNGGASFGGETVLDPAGNIGTERDTHPALAISSTNDGQVTVEWTDVGTATGNNNSVLETQLPCARTFVLVDANPTTTGIIGSPITRHRSAGATGRPRSPRPGLRHHGESNRCRGELAVTGDGRTTLWWRTRRAAPPGSACC